MKRPVGLALAVGVVIAGFATIMLWNRTAPDGGSLVMERDGLVTLRVQNALRSESLALLSERLGFELRKGRFPDTRVTLTLEAQPLTTVLSRLLGEIRFEADHRYDPKLGRHRLAALTVGEVERAAPALAKSEFLPCMNGAASAMASASSTASALRPAPPDGPAPTDLELNGEVEMALYNLPDPVVHEQSELKRIARDEKRRAQSLAALDDEDPQVRMAAIEFVEPTKEGLTKLARQAQHDPEEANRVQAVEQLAKGQGVEITNALVGALQDSSAEVVLSALDGIRGSMDYTVAERVKQALEKRSEPQIQEQLRQTLKSLGDSTPTWGGTDYLDRRMVVTASAPNPAVPE